MTLATVMLPNSVLTARNARPPAPARAAPDTTVYTTNPEVFAALCRIQGDAGLSEDELYSILDGWLSAGRIASADKRDPWKHDDLVLLAHQASQYEKNPPPAPKMHATLLARLGLKGGLPAPRPQPASDDPDRELKGASLMENKYNPVHWLIPGLLPEGLGILASPPKTGKSLLCYQMAVEASFGGNLLGIPVLKSHVLYYALEDGPRRSQDRVRKMLWEREPTNLNQLLFRWYAERLGGPLELEVSQWLDLNPFGLVIIDVLAMVRPDSKRRGTNAYDEDYSAIQGIHLVAKQHPGCTILLVTHDRKQGADDWMTTIQGTKGLTGAVDFVILIKRPRDKMTGDIHITGRDAGDNSFQVMFNEWGWHLASLEGILADAEPGRFEVLEYVRDNGSVTVAAIAHSLGRLPDGTRKLLERMVDEGILTKTVTDHKARYQVT